MFPSHDRYGKLIPLIFERKSLGDLFGTMTQGYKRFKEEMKRAKSKGYQLILIIEGNMGTIKLGTPYSKFSGEAMLKKLAMLRVRYDLEYHFFNDRIEMRRFVEDIFSAVNRNFKVGKRAKR